jgi:hypothetical protein
MASTEGAQVGEEEAAHLPAADETLQLAELGV